MKVPEPKKQPSGNWFIQLRLGGKSYPITEATKSECIRQAELIKANYRANNIKVNKNDLLTLDQAIDKYINDKYNTLSPSTRRGYLTYKRTRFLDYRYTKIKDIDWQIAVNEESKLCSARTLKNSWSLIHSTLKYLDLPIPKVKLSQVVVPDLEWLDYEQVIKFVKAVKGESCQIPALLALHSLRRSELYDLKWTDVDLERRIIHVSGAAVDDEHNKLVHKDTNKNKTSKRNIPIMIPDLMNALKSGERKSEYIVTCGHDTATRQINALCEKIGLPAVGVQGLRRSFASLAYHLNWPERTTMEIGGWSNPVTMHRIYVKLAEQDRYKATQSMADFYAAID